MSDSTPLKTNRPPKLTIKRRKWANRYVKSGNGTKSALEVYDTTDYETAQQIASDNMHNPTVQTYIQKILDNEGLTDSKVAQHLNKIMESSVSENALNKAKVQDGLRAIEMIYKLKDRFPAERKQIDKRTLTMNLKGKNPQELEAMLNSTISEAQRFTKLLKAHSINKNE